MASLFGNTYNPANPPVPQTGFFGWNPQSLSWFDNAIKSQQQQQQVQPPAQAQSQQQQQPQQQQPQQQNQQPQPQQQPQQPQKPWQPPVIEPYVPNPPAKPLSLLGQPPITAMQATGVYQDLLGAKAGYEQANNQLSYLGEKLNDPALTSDQRDYIQNLANQTATARQSFNDYATFTRDAANAIGLDISDYTADKSIEHAAQALNNHTAQSVRDLLGLPTPRAQEENRYRELISRGASPAQANRILNRERDAFQENYLSTLNDGIMTYGVNPDGSMNPVGMMLAQKMAPDNPQTALTLFGSGFATPKEAANLNMQAAMNAANNEMKQRLAQASINADMAKTNARFDHDAMMEQFKQDNLNSRFNADQANKLAIAQAQISARLAASGKGKDGKDKETKISPEAQGVFNMISSIYDLIQKGEEDEASNTLSKLTKDILDKDSGGGLQFTSKLSGEEFRTISSLCDRLDEYLNVKVKDGESEEDFYKRHNDARLRLDAGIKTDIEGGTFEDNYNTLLAAYEEQLKQSNNTASQNPNNTNSNNGSANNSANSSGKINDYSKNFLPRW